MSNETTTTKPMLCVECTKPMAAPLRCASCGALNPLPPDLLNYFELFGFPQGFEIDERALHRKYLSLSRAVHPDLIGTQPDDVRQRSLALSAELNRAYETLRNPVARAEYLLSLAGGPSSAQDKAVPGDLLAEMLMLREEIEEASAAHDHATLAAMRQAVTGRHQAVIQKIADLCRALNNPTPEGMKELRLQLNAIKYWDNLLQQLPAGE